MWLNTADPAELFAAGVTVAVLIVSALLIASIVVFFLERDWGRGNEEAEQKARALLRRWLSPAQLEQYEKIGHFEVLGSDSGKRYCIHTHSQMNIDELDERGARVAVWCFLPEGPLAIGDIMLAQKIALETNERAALAIANRGRTG